LAEASREEAFPFVAVDAVHVEAGRRNLNRLVRGEGVRALLSEDVSRSYSSGGGAARVNLCRIKLSLYWSSLVGLHVSKHSFELSKGVQGLSLFRFSSDRLGFLQAEEVVYWS